MKAFEVSESHVAQVAWIALVCDARGRWLNYSRNNEVFHTNDLDAINANIYEKVIQWKTNKVSNFVNKNKEKEIIIESYLVVVKYDIYNGRYFPIFLPRRMTMPLRDEFSLNCLQTELDNSHHNRGWHCWWNDCPILNNRRYSHNDETRWWLHSRAFFTPLFDCSRHISCRSRGAR